MTRDEMVNYIQENYQKIPGKAMARAIGKSSCFVYSIMKKKWMDCTISYT